MFPSGYATRLQRDTVFFLLLPMTTMPNFYQLSAERALAASVSGELPKYHNWASSCTIFSRFLFAFQRLLKINLQWD